MKFEYFHIWIEHEWTYMEMNVELKCIHDDWNDEMVMMNMNEIIIGKYCWKFLIGE